MHITQYGNVQIIFKDMNINMKKTKQHFLGLGFIVILAIVFNQTNQANSFSTGITGFSGMTGPTCSNCHSGGQTPTVTLTGPEFIAPDTIATYALTIAGGQEIAGGFNVAATDGTLAVFPGSTDTQLLSNEMTHTTPQTINDDNEVIFLFQWTSPPITGTVTLYGAGNSVDLSSDTMGDAANTDTFTIEVISFSESVYLPLFIR